MRFRIRVKAVVRAACAALFAVSFFAPAIGAHAQVTATAPVIVAPQYNNRWEIYGGAQYSHFNPSGGRNVAATNLLGWNGTATLNIRPVWGIEMGARGLYGSMSVPPNAYGVPSNPKMSENLFLFGPAFRIFRGLNYAAGVHILVGAAYGSFDNDFPQGVSPNAVGIYNNKLAFGAAAGGFGDYNLSPRLAVRFIADYQPTRYGYTMQNEFAGSVGIVYKFGGLLRK
jgi:hypothetical protein